MSLNMFKKWPQTNKFNIFTVLWIIAFISIIYLYQNWHIDKKCIGIVESRCHVIGAQESGTIQSMLTDVGESVKKGQVLAMLNIADLRINLDRLEKELSDIQSMESYQRIRYSLIAQKMVLQLENEMSALIERLSLIDSKNTEIEGLNNEINRLENAEKAGLGHSRDLADLIIQRDALVSYLKELNKELKLKDNSLEQTRLSQQIIKDANIDHLTKTLLLEHFKYTESLQRDILNIEQRINLRTIVSPCDGYITKVLARSGDIVEAFAPVLAVEEQKPLFLDVYLPEKFNSQPAPGMKFDIFSARGKEFNTTGIVTFIHPGFSQASERVSFRQQIFWARKIRVELAKDHSLIPGEVVTVHLKKKNWLNSKSANVYAGNLQIENEDCFNRNPQLEKMQVPATLLQESRFEPSGICWIPETNSFLIVSDDTGIKDSVNDHAARLFLMDEKGQVNEETVSVIGTRTVNDLEAIAPVGNGDYYLVSSQNISKNGKRPANREFILKLKKQNENYIVQDRVRFLSLLLRSYSQDQLKALGLDQLEEDGKPVLNIEGAAFYENALYFGLKEPVSPQGAIIWKLDDVDSIFGKEKLEPGQLTVFDYVQLQQFNGKQAGISDLLFDNDGKLWALSTIANVDKQNQMGALYRIDRFTDGRLDAKLAANFPCMKPEGICLYGSDRFILVFDNDAECPEYCYINREEL